MVSALINNYNYGAYISEAIESVLAQSYCDWELIIVDDGSTDDSREIIEKYVHEYPKKIRALFKENGGQASCFNAGFALSHGDIIAFLDSDDYWYPEKLANIVKWHDKYDFVGHGKYYSNEEQEKLVIRNKKINQIDGKYYARKYGLFDHYNITTSTMSCKRALAEKIFPMPEEGFRICADHYVKFAALYYEGIHYEPAFLSFYRIHGHNGFVDSSLSKRANYISFFDYITVEYFNRRLSDAGLPLAKHMTAESIKEMKRELGCGYEIKKDHKYVVYGTANRGKNMVREIIDGGGKVYGFCDSNKKLWGCRFMTHMILAPADLIKYRNEYDKVIIASTYMEEIEDGLIELGLSRGKDYMYYPI